jgi:hypothetical protein
VQYSEDTFRDAMNKAVNAQRKRCERAAGSIAISEVGGSIPKGVEPSHLYDNVVYAGQHALSM